MTSSDHPFTDRITRTKAGLLAWHQERVIFETTEMICRLLEREGISRSELAERLEKSPGFISQLLDGTANMTIRTISDVFTVLGYEYHPRAVRPISGQAVAQTSRLLQWPMAPSPNSTEWGSPEITLPAGIRATKSIA